MPAAVETIKTRTDLFGIVGRLSSLAARVRMSVSQRRLFTRRLGIGALALLLLDGIGYFVFLGPLENRLDVERNHRTAVHADLIKEQARVKTLQQYVSELPGADAQIGQFLEKHVPPRQRAFSTADTLVATLSQKTGVDLAGVAYKPETTMKNPLQWLRIDLDAEGGFTNLMDFLQQLQAGNDFILIRTFGLEIRDRGKLSMHLGADLYLTP